MKLENPESANFRKMFKKTMTNQQRMFEAPPKIFDEEQIDFAMHVYKVGFLNGAGAFSQAVKYGDKPNAILASVKDLVDDMGKVAKTFSWTDVINS